MILTAANIPKMVVNKYGRNSTIEIEFSFRNIYNKRKNVRSVALQCRNAKPDVHAKTDSNASISYVIPSYGKLFGKAVLKM